MKVMQLLALAAGVGFLLPAAALSDDTGVGQALHGTKRIGGKLCLVDHFHYGQSSGHKTRDRAVVAAIKDWAGFTAFEYGTDWARYGHSAARKMSCSQAGGLWSCNTESIPCKYR